MTMDQVSIEKLLKETFHFDYVRDLFLGDSPFYNKLNRDTKGGGEDVIRAPLRFGPSGGQSWDIADAKKVAYANKPATSAFSVPYLEYNHWNTATDRALRVALKKGPEAFIAAMDLLLQDLFYLERRWLSIALFKDGWGTIGQIAAGSAVNSTTLLLEDVNDALNFEIGQQLEVATAKGDAAKALGSSNNGLIVTGVDTFNGVLTFGFNVNDATNGIPTIAAGDFIYRLGDAQADTYTAPQGLASYLTQTDLSTPFMGVTRSQNPQRLAGVFVDGNGIPLVEALNRGAVEAIKYGGKPDTCLVSHDTYQTLINANEGKVQVLQHGPAKFGFSTAVLDTARGQIEVMPEICCPNDKMYMLQMDSWKLVTVGDEMYNVGTDVGDSLRLRLDPDYNIWTLRHSFLGNVVCDAPGHNTVVTIGAEV